MYDDARRTTKEYDAAQTNHQLIRYEKVYERICLYNEETGTKIDVGCA